MFAANVHATLLSQLQNGLQKVCKRTKKPFTDLNNL